MKNFFESLDEEQVDELVTYNHLKYGFSVFATETLLKISKDGNEFNENLKSAIESYERIKGLKYLKLK